MKKDGVPSACVLFGTGTAYMGRGGRPMNETTAQRLLAPTATS